MNIQNISSLPPYLSKFINHNLSKLNEIYDSGMKENNNNGLLSFKCSEKDNKMDVFFMNEQQILLNISKESWENLKSTNKKIFLINDIEKNSMFIVYI